MPTGALIAGGLGAIGAIGSSLIGSSAAKSASAAQTALGQQALGMQQSLGQQGIDTLMKMFGIAQNTAQPVINAGFNLANTTGNSLLGAGSDLRDFGRSITDPAAKTLNALLTPGASMSDTLSQIPGFKFAQDWGQKAVQNIGSTTGLGGNVLKAGADYATGVAQQGFGGIVQQLQALLGGGTNILNSGNALTGIGGNVIGTGYGTAGNAANALTGAAINTGNSAFGNLNQLGQTTGNTLTGIGNATASGILGSANAISGGLTGATGAGANALFLSKLLGGGAGGGGAGGGAGIYSTGGVPSSNLLTGGIGSA